MKKVALFMVLVLLASSAAWAGESRSALLSNQELNEIHDFSLKSFPPGSKVAMGVKDDWLGAHVQLLFLTGNPGHSLLFEVYPIHGYARIISAGSEWIVERTGDKLLDEIQNILNRSPRAALGNIID